MTNFYWTFRNFGVEYNIYYKYKVFQATWRGLREISKKIRLKADNCLKLSFSFSESDAQFFRWSPGQTARGAAKMAQKRALNRMRNGGKLVLFRLFQELRNSAPKKPSLIKTDGFIPRSFFVWKTSRPRPASGGPRRIVLERQEVFPSKQEAQND